MKKIGGYQIFTFFNYIFMTAIILVTLYPIWHVIVASFSDPAMLYTHDGMLLLCFLTGRFFPVFEIRCLFL